MSELNELKHLEWLVKSRSQNQESSLKLFKILKSYSTELKLKKNRDISSVGVGLVAVSFSLWRAVFLADGSGNEDGSFDSALKFLGTLISDNAIAYAQDKIWELYR